METLIKETELGYLPKQRSTINGSLLFLDKKFLEIETHFRSLHFMEEQKKFNNLMDLLISTIKLASKNGWDNLTIRKNLPNIWRIYRSTEFVRHIQDWPRGFPGDYQAIDMIVDWQYKANGIFKDIANNWALGSPIAQQHREKLRYQVALVKSVCANFKFPTIVSLACGSSRDLEQVQTEIKKSKARVILIDFDELALEESRRRLYLIQDQLDMFLTDIRKLPRLFRSLSGKSQFIYAGGLFDYLPDGIIKMLLVSLSEFIDNGLLLFTNIAKPNPYRVLIETVGNWDLKEREEEKMKEFLSLTKGEKRLEKDATGLTWFALAKNC